MKLNLLTIIVLIYLNVHSQNNGLLFNSLDENYLMVPDNSAINLTNNFSIEFWIQPKFSENPVAREIIQEGKCVNSSMSYHVILETDATLRFITNCDGSCTYSNVYKCDTPIEQDECIQIAITYSSSGVQFYFNGVAQTGSYIQGGFCGVLNSSAEPLRIGHYITLSNNLALFYDGMLDELRIWSRVLTQSEILTNFESSLVGNESGLELYYNFNGSTVGPGVFVTNNASATGSILNAETFSTDPSTPNSALSVCFSELVVVDSEILTDEINIYPVPSEGYITVDFKGENDVEYLLDISDYQGRVINTITDFKTNVVIDVSNYASGIYFVRVYSESNSVTMEIVIQ